MTFSVPSVRFPSQIAMLATEFVLRREMTYIIFGNLNVTNVNAGTTRYFGPASGATGLTTTENETKLSIPASRFTTFSLRMTTAQPGTGSLVFTVNKNGASTGMVLTIAAGAAAGKYTVILPIVFAAGDDLSIVVVNNAATASGALNGWSLY